MLCIHTIREMPLSALVGFIIDFAVRLFDSRLHCFVLSDMCLPAVGALTDDWLSRHVHNNAIYHSTDSCHLCRRK